MAAAGESFFVSFLGIFLHIWKKKYHSLFSKLKSCSKRNFGWHWKSTFRKRYPFIIFSFTKLYFNTKVLNWTWTFVSVFTLFSYVNPFDIKEYFKCWSNCKMKLVAQTTTRFITGKSFIKVLLFDKNVALAQENTSVSVYYYTFPFPFSQLDF